MNTKDFALPPDVVRLVIAARVVSFSDQSQEAIDELDCASEAFADRVAWDDEPVNISRAQRRYADRS
jgi:hypothetical protein